jgi:ribosomal protein L7Ae-like RNA K-turn-binding protein
MSNALNLLGISRKGGHIAVGEEPVAAAVRSGKSRLILVAQDAADHTFRRARSFSTVGKCAFIKIPYTKDELGTVLGRNVCAMAALTDVRLAQAFVKALGQPEKYAELQADLDARSARVAQRRKEELAHQKNLRHGKHK